MLRMLFEICPSILAGLANSAERDMSLAGMTVTFDGCVRMIAEVACASQLLHGPTG